LRGTYGRTQAGSDALRAWRAFIFPALRGETYPAGLLIIIIIGLFLIPENNKPKDSKPSVLVIDVHGEIVDSIDLTSPDSDFWERENTVKVSTIEISKIIKKYEKEDNIKAFILDIDSNGGGGEPLYDLIKQIRNLDKPVVSVIRDQALSGGYYMASATDRIFANELSNIADIGYITVIDYSKDNISYKKCFISSSEYKAMYYDDCEGFGRTDVYKTTKNRLIESTRIMAREIATFRNLPEPHVQKLADGTIFTGIGALKLGLIDEIGGVHEANDWLESELGSELEIIYYREFKK